MNCEQQVRGIAESARRCSTVLRVLSSNTKDSVLREVAAQLLEQKELIRKANAKDLSAGEDAGLSAALLDRLELTDKKGKCVIMTEDELFAFGDEEA